MGLQRKGAPDAADAALAQPGRLREGAGGPVRGSLRLGFQSARQHPFNGVVAQAARRARTGLIQQSIEAEKDKTLSPFANRGPRDLHAAGDLGVAPPLGAQQHDAGAQGQSPRRFGSTTPLQQALSFGGNQSQGRERATESHAVPPAYIRCRKGRYLCNEY